MYPVDILSVQCTVHLPNSMLRLQALLKEELGALATSLTARLAAGFGRQHSFGSQGSGPCPNPSTGPALESAGSDGTAGARTRPGSAMGSRHPGELPGSIAEGADTPEAKGADGAHADAVGRTKMGGAFGSSIFVAGSPSSADGSGEGGRRGRGTPEKPSTGSEHPPSRPLSALAARSGNGGFGSELHLAGEGGHGGGESGSSGGDDTGGGGGNGGDLTAPLLGVRDGGSKAGEEEEGPEEWYRNRLLLLLVLGYGLVAFLFNIIDEVHPTPSTSRPELRDAPGPAADSGTCRTSVVTSSLGTTSTIIFASHLAQQLRSSHASWCIIFQRSMSTEYVIVLRTRLSHFQHSSRCAGHAFVCCGTGGKGRLGLHQQRAVCPAGRRRRRAHGLGRNRVRKLILIKLN